MTAIVGILCKDGIVVGTDSSATFSNAGLRTIEQPVKKLDVIESQIIVAGTGQVGMGQRFCGIVKTTYDEKIFSQKPHLDVGRILSKKAISDFVETGAKQGAYGALVAYSHGNQFYLCEFAVADFQPEFKTNSMFFVSMGCGQSITDPFLGLMRRIFWKDGAPGVTDAIFIATWTLRHAIDLNPGGINEPIQMAVIRQGKGDSRFSAQLLSNSDLLEHNNNVDDAEKYLSQYKEILLGKTSTTKMPTV